MITTDTPRTAIAIAEARAEVWQRSAEQAFAEGDADAGERYEARREPAGVRGVHRGEFRRVADASAAPVGGARLDADDARDRDDVDALERERADDAARLMTGAHRAAASG
jgi:hypothetical protein